MINKAIPVTIKEKEYEILVNVGSMLVVEKVAKKGFMEVLKDTDKGELRPIAILLSACLKDKKKSVGIDFVEKLQFEEMEALLNPLMEAITNSFPTGDDKKN